MSQPQNFIRFGQLRSGQVRLGYFDHFFPNHSQEKSLSLNFIKLGQVRLGQVRLGQVRLGQVRLGQVRQGYNQFGKVRIGQVRSGFFDFFILNSRSQLRRVCRKTSSWIPASSGGSLRPQVIFETNSSNLPKCVAQNKLIPLKLSLLLIFLKFPSIILNNFYGKIRI